MGTRRGICLYTLLTCLVFEAAAQSSQEPAASDDTDFIHHMVVPGNTLWEIADHYLGNPWLWEELVPHNPWVEDPDWIDPGTVVRIPVERTHVIPLGQLADITAWNSPAEKHRVITDLFDLPDFLNRTIDFAAQQMEIRNRSNIGTSVEAIEEELRFFASLQKNRIEPPDLVAFLIPRPDKEPEEPIGIDPDADNDMALNNMLLDETRTPIGSDFYERLYQQWEFPRTEENFFVRILERPLPHRGSQIVIEVNHETVHQFMLQPDRERIRNIADATARGLRQYLENYDQMSPEYF